ncbi:MAG: hypothetical protein RLZZ457_9 [Pseudomonadota bacterium]
MAFITLCLKKTQRLDQLLQQGLKRWRQLAVFVLACLCLGGAWADTSVEMQGLKVERSEQDVYVSVNWRFEVPSALEDALLKGIPLYFVTEVDVSRERWYFYDKRVAHAERHVRVSYLPLTRRWRVNISPQPFSAGGLGMSLAQTYDSLDEAMTAVRRLVQWRVAPAADVESDAKQTLVINFRLDLTQLPRPMQIGAAGQSDWNLSLSKTQRLVLEPQR